MRHSVSAPFDDTLMPRAPQKAALANAIWTRLPPDIAGPTGEVQHALDGGALLHRITWPHGLPTYQEICALYCDYFSRNFGLVIVVFDGYRIPSTKYITHQRLTGGEVGIEVTFTGDVKLTMSKDVFLSNVANKQNMLSHYLQLAECLTEHAEEDADLLIAQTAVQSAATKNTVLVADDTDLVILLCYYADPDGFDLFMQFSTRGTTKKNRIWDIKVTQSELGAYICNNILFIHAILGCDTTSRLYGLGKGLSLKRFTSSALFRDKAEQFCKKDTTVDDVIDAGEAALVCMYHIRPQTLPPTSAAARYHNVRVYLQVQQWLVVCNMKKTDWGWMTKDENVVPVMTLVPPTPDELLLVIRCNCKTECSTARCSCRKHSLECSPTCGQCRGIGYSNSTATDISDEDDDDDDDDR